MLWDLTDEKDESLEEVYSLATNEEELLGERKELLLEEDVLGKLVEDESEHPPIAAQSIAAVDEPLELATAASALLSLTGDEAVIDCEERPALESRDSTLE